MQLKDILDHEAHLLEVETPNKSQQKASQTTYGGYLYYTIDKRATEAIENFCEDFEIPNAAPKEDLHVKLASFDGETFSVKAEGTFDSVVGVTYFELEKMDTAASEAALIAVFESDFILEKRRELAREYQLDLETDDYRPFIVISTNLESKEVDMETLSYQFNKYLESGIQLTGQQITWNASEWTSQFEPKSSNTKKNKKRGNV